MAPRNQRRLDHKALPGYCDEEFIAWDIGKPNLLKMRQKIDLGKKLHMNWLEQQEPPRVLNEHGRPEAKYKEPICTRMTQSSPALEQTRSRGWRVLGTK